MRIQARRPGSKLFRTVSSGYSSNTGTFRAVYRPTAVGTWRFRLFLPATAKATQAVSPSRTITATKPIVPRVVTTAVLSLNGSTGTSAKQTVNLSEAFDITGTHAGEGLTLVSGSLDYGDGTPAQTFTGDPAGWTPDEHQYATPGMVTATWTVVDSAGTSAKTSVQVTVFDEPTATISMVAERHAGAGEAGHVHGHVPDPGRHEVHRLRHLQPRRRNVRQRGPRQRCASGAVLDHLPEPRYLHRVRHGDNDAGGLAEASVDVVVPDLPTP